MVKPMKTLELHYPKIQFLIKIDIAGAFGKSVIPANSQTFGLMRVQARRGYIDPRGRLTLTNQALKIAYKI